MHASCTRVPSHHDYDLRRPNLERQCGSCLGVLIWARSGALGRSERPLALMARHSSLPDPCSSALAHWCSGRCLARTRMYGALSSRWRPWVRAAQAHSSSVSTSESRVHKLFSSTPFPPHLCLHSTPKATRGQETTCRQSADISSSSVSPARCARARLCSTSSTSGKETRAVSTQRWLEAGGSLESTPSQA